MRFIRTEIPHMKTIFDPKATAEIKSRIETLSSGNHAQWGKMDIYQMLRHCSLCEDMMQGKLTIRRVFIGRIIGKMILKQALTEGRPFGKNSPTSPLLKTVGQNGNFDAQKSEWLQKIDGYEQFDNYHFVHPFFGKMSKEQIGVFVYKHADHHLRQFGA